MPQMMLPERHHGGVWKRTAALPGAAVLPAEDILDFNTQVEVPYGVARSTPIATYELGAGGLWQISGHIVIEGTGVAEYPRFRIYDARNNATLFVEEFGVGPMGGERYPYSFCVRRRLDFGAQIRFAFSAAFSPINVVIVTGTFGCEVGFTRLGR